MKIRRGAALIAVLVGGAGSLGLMLYAGRRQNSGILVLLFGTWVLSPFMAAGLANAASKRWPVLTQATLHVVTLLFSVGCLAIYAVVAFRYVEAKIGFVFLVVPLASWVLLAVSVAAAAFISSRLSH